MDRNEKVSGGEASCTTVRGVYAVPAEGGPDQKKATWSIEKRFKFRPIIWYSNIIFSTSAVVFSSLSLVRYQITSCWSSSLACIRPHLYYSRFTHQRGVYLLLSTQYPIIGALQLDSNPTPFDVSIHTYTLTINCTHDSLCFLPHGYLYSSTVCCFLTIIKPFDIDLLSSSWMCNFNHLVGIFKFQHPCYVTGMVYTDFSNGFRVGLLLRLSD